MTAKKPGVWKVWGDYPVRLYDWHLSDIYWAVSACSEASGGWDSFVRTEVNGRTIDGTRPEWVHQDWSPVDQVTHDPRIGRVKSVAFISREVTVHLGPRTVYAYGTGDTAEVRGALFAIEHAIGRAVRRPGAFLVRTWGAAIAVAVAFLIGANAFRPWDEDTKTSALVTVLAVATYLGATAYAGLLNRVVIDPGTVRGQSGFWRRNSDALATTFLATVVGGLALAAVLALAGVLTR